MYLMINGNRHTVSRRIANPDTVRYLNVTPEPETVTGKVQMFENGGFLISEDNADGFVRFTYTGTTLTITNVPEPEIVEPEHFGEEGVTWTSMANAIAEGVNEV